MLLENLNGLVPDKVIKVTSEMECVCLIVVIMLMECVCGCCCVVGARV